MKGESLCEYYSTHLYQDRSHASADVSKHTRLLTVSCAGSSSVCRSPASTSLSSAYLSRCCCCFSASMCCFRLDIPMLCTCCSCLAFVTGVAAVPLPFRLAETYLLRLALFQVIIPKNISLEIALFRWDCRCKILVKDFVRCNRWMRLDVRLKLS